MSHFTSCPGKSEQYKIALVTGVSNDGQIGQSVAQIFTYNGAGIGMLHGHRRMLKRVPKSLRQKARRRSLFRSISPMKPKSARL